MLSGIGYHSLNELVNAITADPSVVKWDNKDKGFSTPLTKPAEFSDAVKAMVEQSVSAEGVDEEVDATLSATEEVAAPEEEKPELTEEEKHRLYIEEQTRLAVEKINKAQEGHLENVREWSATPPLPFAPCILC
jgi:hypothetical protein